MLHRRRDALVTSRNPTLPSAGSEQPPSLRQPPSRCPRRCSRNAQSLRPERLPDGVRLETGGGFLTLRVKSDGIVRVTFSSGREFRGDQMAVLGPESPALNPFQSTPAAAPSVRHNADLDARCDRHGRHARHGEASCDGGWRRHRHVCRQRRTTILAEAPGGRRIESTTSRASRPITFSNSGRRARTNPCTDSASVRKASWTSRATISTSGSATPSSTSR